MFMMQLRKLKTLIEQERKENDRLPGVISEMDYDRIAWAEYVPRTIQTSSSCVRARHEVDYQRARDARLNRTLVLRRRRLEAMHHASRVTKPQRKPSDP